MAKHVLKSLLQVDTDATNSAEGAFCAFHCHSHFKAMSTVTVMDSAAPTLLPPLVRPKLTTAGDVADFMKMWLFRTSVTWALASCENSPYLY